MAQQPDGKPARPERVTFTKPAAQRIARVVRTVESGDRTQAGLSFSRVTPQQKQTSIRLARYTSTNSWVKGTTHQVLLVTADTSAIYYSGSTTTAYNRFALIAGHTGSTATTTLGVLLTLTRLSGNWWVTNAEV